MKNTGVIPKTAPNLTQIAKTEREKRNMSQFEAAERIGMDRRTYQRREQDDSFTISEFKRLISLFGLDLVLLPKDFNSSVNGLITKL